jgi:transposase, IS30 family
LHDAANEGLAEEWSPQQIARRPQRDYPADEVMRVSAETIYEIIRPGP